MKTVIDAEYEARPERGILDRMLAAQYQRMFDAFMEFKRGDPGDTVLDVRVTPRSLTKQHAYYPDWSVLHESACVTTSCEIDLQNHAVSSAAAARRAPQNLVGRKLSYEDGQFDWVYCNGLIEHAGSFEKQYELLKELARVARKGVFVTTANRWHPLEFNTALPFLHWLPRAVWRYALKVLGRRRWASEAVLNPLGLSDLRKLTSLLPCKPSSDVGHVRIGGVKAHFFLMIRKNRGSAAEGTGR